MYHVLFRIVPMSHLSKHLTAYYICFVRINWRFLIKIHELPKINEPWYIKAFLWEIIEHAHLFTLDFSVRFLQILLLKTDLSRLTFELRGTAFIYNTYYRSISKTPGEFLSEAILIEFCRGTARFSYIPVGARVRGTRVNWRRERESCKNRIRSI